MSTLKKPREWTEERVTDLLRIRYKGSAWAFLPKVRNGTGWRRSARTADALAMSLWPSRGLHLYGFEIKVDRSDWLRELNDPEKAEDIFGFCDFWYIVAPAGIVNHDEMPKTWGLLEIGGKGLREAVTPPKLTPKPVDSLFLASLLRKVTENMASDQQMEEARQRGVKDGIEEGKHQTAREIGYAEDKRQKAEERVETFERVTGLSFDNWKPTAETAAAVKAVLCGEDKRIISRLTRIRDEIKDLLEQVDKSIEFKEKNAGNST